MNISRSLALGLALGVVQAPASAQTVTPSAAAEPLGDDEQGPASAGEAAYDDADEVEAVVVTAERLRGAVAGDIAPDIQLDARDIRALGAGTVQELLDSLAPQIRSGRGREDGPPITLLNGRRISGFREIRSLPPEAIERIDILPEEVALKYGYRADQRVVNIVLRERFRALTAEAEFGGATAGGRGEVEGSLNFLRINRNGRWSFEAERSGSGALLESERDLVSSRSGGLFDLQGNLGGAAPGGEIDPALSALVGRPVSVAGVPRSASAGAPTLADFAATAGEANLSDLGAFRTLLPATDQVSMAGTVNRIIFDDVSATLNARFDSNDSQSLFGLPSAALLVPAGDPFSPFAADVTLYRYLEGARPLTRDSRSETAGLGLALNGEAAEWHWSLTANYDFGRSLIRTDTGIHVLAIQAPITASDPGFNLFGPIPDGLILGGARDRSRSTTRTGNAELVASGTLLELPAGPLSATVRTGAETRSFESETFRRGAEAFTDLSRERANAQINLDLPIASRRREVLTVLGDLTANANLEVDRLSDFGTLTTLGYGVNWSPVEKLSLIGSVTKEAGAPSVQQLGAPVLLTPNVPVFDFTTGETVDVTRIEGGNSQLSADDRQVLKLGLTLKPFEARDLSITLNYNASRILNPISSFPAITPEIEAAFPERFVRDPEGRLLSVDNRPVNFARSDRKDVRTGFNYSRPLRRAEQAGAGGPGGAPEGDARPDQRRGGQTPGPGAGGPGAGGRRGGFGGGREGRLQLALFHTWRLEDTILIREGLPELDLLDGSAAGARGGRSEHELELQAGLFRSGLGARVDARWQSGTTLRARRVDATEGAGDLTFSAFSTVNLRLFADLGQQRALVTRRPWLRGSRVSLAVNSLFDNRLEVRDPAGLTPLGYQAAYLDPLGRSVTVSLRKLFIPRRGPGRGPGQNQGDRPRAS